MAEPVIVVSGLPRSGTSLAMRMLEAAGIEILRDDVRAPDADNPHGYYEYDPVRATKRDASWVDQAAGKAVKVIHAFLGDLPGHHRYRVIAMERPIAQVLASQRAMLARRGADEAADDAALERALRRDRTRALREAERNPRFEVLRVDYPALVADPAPHAAAIAAFVGRPEAAATMARVVEPALHRQHG